MTKPLWLFKPAKHINGNLLKVFQKEGAALWPTLIKKLDQYPNQLVSETDLEKFKQDCPYLYKYLKLINVVDFIERIGFGVTTKPENLPIHTDAPATAFALNMPILNCDDTYLAWYNATQRKGEYAVDYASDSWHEVSTAAFFDKDFATEIARIHAIEPHWVNVENPHAVLYGPNKSYEGVRVIITVRFDHRIYDYLTNLYGPE